MRSPAAIAVAAYTLALTLFVVFVAVPFLDKRRDIPAAVPSPPALRELSLLGLRPGDRVCMKNLAISAESRSMRFVVGTYGKPGPPLRVSVDAPAYRARAAVRGGFRDNSTVYVPVPPPLSSRLAAVCIRNVGRRKLALYAAADSAHSRVQVSVDGRPQYPTPQLAFAQAAPISIADQAGVTAGRIAVFRGFLDHAWIIWVLAALALIGVPLLVGLALYTSERATGPHV